MRLNIYKLILYFINLLIKYKIKINKSYLGFKLTYQVTRNKSSMINLHVGFFLLIMNVQTSSYILINPRNRKINNLGNL